MSTNPLLSSDEQAYIDTVRANCTDMTACSNEFAPQNAWEWLKHTAATIDYWRWFRVFAVVLNLAGFTYLLGMFITYVDYLGFAAINSAGLLLMSIYHLHAVWTMESDDGIKTILHTTGMYVLVIAF